MISCSPVGLVLQTCLCILCQGGISRFSSALAKGLNYMMMFCYVALTLILRRSDALLSSLSSQNFFISSLYIVRACENYTGEQLKVCSQNQIVYRLGFVTTLIFFPVFILSFCNKYISSFAHRGFFGVKLVAFFVLILLSPWIPNVFIDFYVSVAKYLAPIFIIIQIISLIDFSYTWNNIWVSNFEQSGSYFWLRSIVAIGIITLVSGFIFSIWGYFKFASAKFYLPMLVNLFVSCFNTAVSLSSIAPHGTLLTSGILFAYSTYALWNAVSSAPTLERYVSSDFALFIGLVVISISISWNCSTLSNKPDLFHLNPENDVNKCNNAENNKELIEDVENDNSDNNNVSTTTDQDSPFAIQWLYAVLLFAVFYITMVWSNWTTISNSVSSNDSWVVYWIGVSSVGLLQLLYGWTLWAPYLLPGRDFGQ